MRQVFGVFLEYGKTKGDTEAHFGGNMNLPLHPVIVHMPLALGFLMPILALVVAWFQRKGRWPMSTWYLVLALQVGATASAYLALQTGEQEEKNVVHVVGKPPLAEHEARAEMYAAGSVAASALSVLVPFLKIPVHTYVQLAAVVVMVGNTILAWRVGESGGGLVYKYGAAEAYRSQALETMEVKPATGEEAPQGILPTPGMNTSESPYPREGSEYNPAEDDEPEEADKD